VNHCAVNMTSVWMDSWAVSLPP